MIELRWVRRETTVLDNSSGIIGEPYPKLKTTVRVLQFRTQVMQIVQIPVSRSGGTLYMQEKPMGYTWTDWQDVPEASPPTDIPHGAK